LEQDAELLIVSKVPATAVDKVMIEAAANYKRNVAEVNFQLRSMLKEYCVPLIGESRCLYTFSTSVHGMRAFLGVSIGGVESRCCKDVGICTSS
jgi:hypothetical protein